MKKAKERIVSIDYFRGICILAVLLNHAYPFSKPFAYFAGDGGLWVSAAELFLLLSGLTFAIVRGPQILSDFSAVLKKTLRRSLVIYSIKILIVFASLFIALWLTAHGLSGNVSGDLPSATGFHLIWSILNSSYAIGWASFLMYYAVFMVFAPFAMCLLRTKYWLLLPAVSVSVLIATHGQAPDNLYYSFGYWQTYFVMGLILGRFRQSITLFAAGVTPSITRTIKGLIVASTTLMLGVSILLNFPLYPWVAHMTNGGWLPVKLQSAYIDLRYQKSVLDNLFMDSRTGLLRPVMALLIFASVYFVYHRYEDRILRKTGSFILTMGRNTLAIFVAQAIAIPMISSLDLPRTLLMNTVLTGFLILCMWLVARTNFSRKALAAYIAGLKETYNTGKYAYIRRYADD